MAVLESTSITLNISAYCQKGLRLLRTELHTGFKPLRVNNGRVYLVSKLQPESTMVD